MRTEIERVLAPLVGLSLRSATRVGELLRLEIGGGAPADGDASPPASYVLEVAAPWRLADGDRILVGSGDLLTPADPEADLETFDWDAPGASWLEVRLTELAELGVTSGVPVASVVADAFGGIRLALAGGVVLEVFPTSTPTGHVTTEFWRLARPGTGEVDVVVGTFGMGEE